MSERQHYVGEMVRIISDEMPEEMVGMGFDASEPYHRIQTGTTGTIVRANEVDDRLFSVTGVDKYGQLVVQTLVADLHFQPEHLPQ